MSLILDVDLCGIGFHSAFLKSAIVLEIFPIRSKQGNIMQYQIFLPSGIGGIRLRSMIKTYAATSIFPIQEVRKLISEKIVNKMSAVTVLLGVKLIPNKSKTVFKTPGARSILKYAVLRDMSTNFNINTTISLKKQERE